MSDKTPGGDGILRSAALAGSALTVEWLDVTDVPGWFVCDSFGPVEGSYETKQDAMEARAARV